MYTSENISPDDKITRNYIYSHLGITGMQIKNLVKNKHLQRISGNSKKNIKPNLFKLAKTEENFFIKLTRITSFLEILVRFDSLTNKYCTSIYPNTTLTFKPRLEKFLGPFSSVYKKIIRQIMLSSCNICYRLSYSNQIIIM